jgi:hypothetical protein
MLEQDEHGGLHDSDRRSIILYVHGRELYYCVCVTLFKAELNLRKVRGFFGRLVLASAQAVTLRPKARQVPQGR